MIAKRLGDLAVSSVLLMLLSPLLATCGLLVFLADGRPVLFRQVRIGRFGQPFEILKFRTMRTGQAGAQVTTAGDPRVTPVGRWLRRFKLDELPQLWNVLVGEMSLVGPRPEVPGYVAVAARGYRALATLRPGITDWASLAFRDEEAILARHATVPGFYAAVLLPRKVALGRLYLRHRSAMVDCALVTATAALTVRQAWLMEALAGKRLLARARRGIAS